MVEYSKTPIALVYENILTEYQCNSLINFVKNNNLLFKSEVYNKQTNKIELDSVRTSSNCSVFYEEHIVAVEIRKIVSDIIKLPIENFEPIQIVRYEVGEHYGLHYDLIKKIDYTKSHKLQNKLLNLIEKITVMNCIDRHSVFYKE